MIKLKVIMILFIRKNDSEKIISPRPSSEELVSLCLRKYAGRKGILLNPSTGGNPADLCRIKRSEHGKPYFADPLLKGIFFSVSHSGDCWAALFHNTEVGLDIEATAFRRSLDRERIEKISRRYFVQDELKRVLDTEFGAQEITFLSIWTAKEAYIKYTGNGLSQNLRSFSVFTAEPRIITASAGGEFIYSYTSADQSAIESIVNL
jgi:phosphopantetheinyl transferase